MSQLFIVRTPSGDSIGYVTLTSSGIQFQADDDFFTGKLTARESIELAVAILDEYSVEYSMLKGSIRKCPTPDIHASDTIPATRMDMEDA
jgi:hypothetical protein